MLGGMALSRLIDPEMARATSDYARNFRLLQMAAAGAVMAVAGLVVALWLVTCYLVLKARQRSALWLPLAAGGPFGFMLIAMLADRAPAPGDLYQQFIRRLKSYWRALFEIAVFISAWVLAYQCVVVKREFSIAYESFATGVPVADDTERQNASSGMYAFGEGLEAMYLVILVYLLWPVLFNWLGRRFKR
jgi:hypothetical protein